MFILYMHQIVQLAQQRRWTVTCLCKLIYNVVLAEYYRSCGWALL